MKTTKRALFSSVIALILCFSMLVGTTFAWFTDSVESGVNQIIAGNLDVELYNAIGIDENKKVDTKTMLFDGILWEPGVVAYENLTVANLGTLALKYQLSVNFTNATTNAKGETLAKVLKVGVVEGGVATDVRENALGMVNTWQDLESFVRNGKLLPKDYQGKEVVDASKDPVTYGIVIYWAPSDFDNDFNMNNGLTNKLTIDLGVKLLATQLEAEMDSFGSDYDADAWLDEATYDWYDPSATECTLSTAADLAGFAAIVNGIATAPTTYAAEGEPEKIQDPFAGKTIVLAADIDLNNMPWAPINGFKGTFDGQGHTISNLVVNGGENSDVGLFGKSEAVEIKNLTVENAKVSGRLNVGVVAGHPWTTKLTNITVTGHVEVNGFAYVGGVGGKNAYADWTNITVDVDNTSYVKAISTEDGTQYRTYVGGVVGFNGEGGHTFKNITTNIDVYGDVCDIGGAFGIGHYNNKFENVTVTGNVIASADAFQVGGILGVWHNQNDTSVTLTDCEFTGKITVAGEAVTDCNFVGGAYSADGTGDLIITNFVDIDGATYAKDGVTGEQTLYLVPADYTDKTFVVAEGTDYIGNYAFAYNSNVKTVVLASTVRDLGRGFDSSSVEKVVLNEGLTTISSRAFKSTTALKEVVISSTVTEIADNAFQKSGIKEIVIPANVKTIGETAFSSSLIEKVTFEGDIAIQGYAFRGCTKLRTVVMNGYDVTFVASTLNGRNSCWFCNGESNNPNTSNITFYVKNAEIKNRVLTAMGAEKNNTPVVVEQTTAEGGYYVDANGNAAAYDTSALNAALSDKKDVVLGTNVNVSASEAGSNGYGAAGISILNGQTLDGNGNALGVNKWGTWDSAINTTGGTIKNLTVNNGMRGIFISHNSTYAAKVILENVVIDGTIYTISCDQGTGNGLEATNCVFNGWTSYAATLGNVKFVDCSFGEGQGYAFCRPYAPTEFVGCDFAAGYELDAAAAVSFKDCTIGGQPLTAENLATLVVSGIANATVK